MATPATVWHLEKDFTNQVFKEDHTGIGNAGDPNPVWPLILTCLTWGLYVKKRPGGGAMIEGIKDFELFGVQQAVGLAAIGFQIENYPAWVKLPNDQLDDAVPSYLTGAYHTNEDGTQGDLKTWAEWGVNDRPLDTHTYIELNSSGAWELGSVFAQLVAGGFTVMNTYEVKAEIEQLEPPSDP